MNYMNRTFSFNMYDILNSDENRLLINTITREIETKTSYIFLYVKMGVGIVFFF